MAKPKGQRKSDQLVNPNGGGVPAAITDPSKAPIGVAPDYTFPATDAFGQTAAQVKPRYFSGSQRTEVVSLSKEDRGDLQYRLKALGLIPSSTKLMLGVWDDPSANGFKEVLAWANATGTDWRSALDDMESAALAAPPPEPTQTKAATNPLDFQALGDNLGLTKLGRGLSLPEEEKFAREAAAEQAPMLMSDSTTADPGSAGWEKWGETRVREFDPLAFDARKVAGMGDVIAKALRGEQ